MSSSGLTFWFDRGLKNRYSAGSNLDLVKPKLRMSLSKVVYHNFGQSYRPYTPRLSRTTSSFPTLRSSPRPGGTSEYTSPVMVDDRRKAVEMSMDESFQRRCSYICNTVRIATWLIVGHEVSRPVSKRPSLKPLYTSLHFDRVIRSGSAGSSYL